jgi:hypothetical protein
MMSQMGFERYPGRFERPDAVADSLDSLDLGPTVLPVEPVILLLKLEGVGGRDKGRAFSVASSSQAFSDIKTSLLSDSKLIVETFG